MCEQAGEAAASLVSAPFDWLAQGLGGLAGWLFEQMWMVFDQTTLVDVTNPAYTKVYALMFGTACAVMLLFFCFQLLLGLIRREPGALGRAVTGLGRSVLGSFLVLTVTGLLLEAVDHVCVGIVQATGNTMAGMGGRIAALTMGLGVVNVSAPGAGALLTIFLAGLLVSSALVVWFSLLVRKALLLVALVFGPFAMAGSGWDPARGWLGKWASFVVAMVLSKLVLVITLLIGVSLAGSPLEPDLQSISEPVTGVVLMLIAAFAPYMTYKFIAFMGSDIYHLMSAEQEAKQALNRPVPIRPVPSQPPSTLPDADDTGASSPPPSPPPSPPSAASAGAEAGSASAGAGAAGGGAAGSSAAAGAGPAAAIVIGAELVEGAATAGPEAGGAVGGAADSASQPADAQQSSAPTVTVFTPTSSSPPPEPPPAPGQAA